MWQKQQRKFFRFQALHATPVKSYGMTDPEDEIKSERSSKDHIHFSLQSIPIFDIYFKLKIEQRGEQMIPFVM